MPSRQTQLARPNSRSSHAPECVSAVWFAAIALVAFAACDTPGVTLVDPEISNPDPAKGTTIHVALEDSALAAALGWSRSVPNADIQLHRIIDPFQPLEVYTDSTGRARLPRLLPGLYKIAALRSLGEDETGSTAGVIRAFGDGLKADLPATTVRLVLRAATRGSIVISELYPAGSSGRHDYQWEQYVELYNNSDTTIFLDGLLLGRAYGHLGSNINPCDEVLFREDPLGIWSIAFHRFPGRGADHPLLAGQAVTIAMDAVDHSVVDPELPNLSGAHFEFEGTADADNPDVPNMSMSDHNPDPEGHGMKIWLGQVLFLALPVLPEEIVESLSPSGRIALALIPAGRILDVLATEKANATSAPYSLPKYYCRNWVNRTFDSLEGGHFIPGLDPELSLHRRTLRYASDGRAILQDTNVSFWDFVVASRSAGRIDGS